jgi:hypothetical protein
METERREEARRLMETDPKYKKLFSDLFHITGVFLDAELDEIVRKFPDKKSVEAMQAESDVREKMRLIIERATLSI